MYEYECESHTTEELIDLSSRISRTNMGKKEKWIKIKVYDNIHSGYVKEHTELYNRMRKQEQSKL